MKKIRVMVVDDSALMRKLISDILSMDPAIEVATTAMDGLFALRKIPQVKPDVITLDLDMPRMDGLTALRYIVHDHRIPVILVSSLTTTGGNLTLEGLAIGAVDFVTKPADVLSSHIREVARELIEKVKIASMVAVGRAARPALPRLSAAAAASEKRPRAEALTKVVAIGVSTGGPNAISALLPQLPADFGAAILIVQHMPEGFTQMFAGRLNQSCRIQVREACEGDRIEPGLALIAPGNRHLKVTKLNRRGVAVLSAGPPVNGHRPSVDVLFDSVAQEFGGKAVGLLMTGMGEDGARGLGLIRSAGGYTLAQDEESSVVFGMPKAAIELGHADEIVSLDGIPGRLISLVKEVHACAGKSAGDV